MVVKARVSLGDGRAWVLSVIFRMIDIAPVNSWARFAEEKQDLWDFGEVVVEMAKARSVPQVINQAV